MNTIVGGHPAIMAEQKKGRPSGRPYIALDCCAPNVHPYTVETSLQLALPVPYKCAGTSLLASLLKINICHHLASVKQILIIISKIEIQNYFTLFNNQLSNLVIFNILKLFTIFNQFLAISQQNTQETLND